MPRIPVTVESGHAFATQPARALTRESPFSYRCNRCTRCCSQYRIPVGPYDLLRLAQALGTSTTDVIRRHVRDGLYLRRREDGACEFLDEQGCAVHGGRPLVCRIYPLGRHVAQGQESFSPMEPIADSAGQWGDRGTVRDYLEQQDAFESIEGVSFYLDLHAQLLRRLREAPLDPDAELDETWKELGASGIAAQGMLDPDAATAAYCTRHGLPHPQSCMDKAACHGAALHEWMDNLLEKLK